MFMMAGAAIGAGLAAISISGANKAAVANYKAQVKAMTLNYNYGLTNIDRQGRSAYDQTVQELFNMSLNSMKNQSMIEAAQAESGVEGRSSEKVMQDVVASDERAKTGVKVNFERQAENLRNESQSLYLSTKSQMEAAYSNMKGATTSGFGSVLKIASGALQGALMGQAIGGSISQAMTGSPTASMATQQATKGAEAVNRGLGYGVKAGSLNIPTDVNKAIAYNKARF